MTVTISGAAVELGEREWVRHRLGRDADRTPIDLELCVVNGTADGPTLWAQGCIHGNEPVGGLAVREFVSGVDPDDVHGAIVGLPVANPSAFTNKRRGSQICHVGNSDVNGVFPGEPDGPFPDRLAHDIYSLVETHADVALDLHSADEQTVMHTGFAYVPTAEEIHERTRRLATATGVDHHVELPPERMDGFLVAELARAGIPAIIVESGSGATVYDFARKQYLDALTNVAKAIGVLPGEADPNDPTVHDDLCFVFAESGGYVEMFVRGGERVAANETVGEVTDIRGDVVETVTAPVDADVLAVRSFPTARPGDMMIELAPAGTTSDES
jgi:predicted deacylase